MTFEYPFVVTAAAGLETLLERELKALLPDTEMKAGKGQVVVHGDLAAAYKVVLWSRLGSRVLLPLIAKKVANADELFDAAYSVPWNAHIGPEHTFSVDFKGSNKWLRHTRFGALKIKDALCDRIRDLTDVRPNVDTKNPSVRIYGHIHNDIFSCGLDLSGMGMHRRGYREGGALAPLRENLAAALLYQMKWPEMAADNKSFMDPMCGSGTLILEASMMAYDIAPGLHRGHYGFSQWYKHDETLWNSIYEDALLREAQGMQRYEGTITGGELNHKALQAAQRGVKALRLGKRVKVVKNDLFEGAKELGAADLIITNPPYGERVGEEAELAGLYKVLAEAVLETAPEALFGVFTSRLDLCKFMPLRGPKRNSFMNGDIDVYLLQFNLADPNSKAHSRSLPTQIVPVEQLSEGARSVYNRIKKNQRGFKAWLKRDDIHAYRVYDADLPEYSVAVDIYGDRVMVQEYAAPAKIPEEKTKARLREALAGISAAMDVAPIDLAVKERRRQKGAQQYEKQGTGSRFQVKELGANVNVDVDSYLDSGLFLDHRPLRRRIAAELSKGQRFLNLFCYTAVASLHAARSGAKTTSIDMSRTYLNWGRDNFIDNQLNLEPAHEFIQADVLVWLKTSAAHSAFDVIMLDPPTFSNSKRMERDFDVQTDHVELVDGAMKALTANGTLYFSNNFRKFKLAPELSDRYDVEDISADTFDPDFKRNGKIHYCWAIKHRG